MKLKKLHAYELPISQSDSAKVLKLLDEIHKLLLAVKRKDGIASREHIDAAWKLYRKAEKAIESKKIADFFVYRLREQNARLLAIVDAD